MEIMQTKAINTFHPPETNEIVVKKSNGQKREPDVSMDSKDKEQMSSNISHNGSYLPRPQSQK